MTGSAQLQLEVPVDESWLIASPANLRANLGAIEILGTSWAMSRRRAARKGG